MDALGNYSDSSGSDEAGANRVEENNSKRLEGKKSKDVIQETVTTQKPDKRRERVDGGSHSREKSYGSHKRHRSRSRSRSPPRRSSKHRSHHRDRDRDIRRSRSPPRRRSRSPRESRSSRHEHSSSYKQVSSSQKGELSSSFVKSSSKQKDQSEDNTAKCATEGVKSTAQAKPEDPSSGPPTAKTPTLLGGRPVSQETGALVDTIPECDMQQLEQAIAAARDIAIKLPPYTRPMMTEQQRVAHEKRKLLWSGKKNKVAQSRNQWEKVSFGKDGEDTKFRRLMGIGESKASQPVQSTQVKGEGSVQDSERTLNALEQQYEASRYLTHIARGAGLGYGSQALTTELPSQKDPNDKLNETL